MEANSLIRNRLLFELEQKIEISQGGDNKNLAAALSANKEFSRYGYTLELRGVFVLAQNDIETIKTIKDQVCQILDGVVGLSDYSKSEPFYPNFPEEVMQKSEMELALNAMVYYLFSQTDSDEMNEIAFKVREMVTSDSADRILREPLTDIRDQDLKVIGYAEPGELEKVMYSMTQALSLPKAKKEIMEKYIKLYPKDWAARLFGSLAPESMTVPSHEIRAELAYLSYVNGNTDITDKLLVNTEDVLRLAAVISNHRSKKSAIMDSNLSVQPEYAVFSLSRKDKKALKSFLETKADLFTSVWHREDYWKKLMNRLDTRNCNFPRVMKVFDNIHNNERLNEDGTPIAISSGQALEHLMEEIVRNPETSGPYIEEFARKYPKVFVRNIMRIARELSPESSSLNSLINGIENNCGCIPAVQLLKLINMIDMSEGWDFRVFTNQKGTTHAEENKVKKIDIRIRCRLIETIDKVIDRNLADKPVGKVYIDPQLATIKAPLRNVRNASKGAALTKYSIVDGEKDKNLVVFGIFWRNDGKERADIDLSVTGFKESYANPEVIFYGQLKQSWGVHSGDYTSGQISKDINGAVEYIFVDKKKCTERGIRYIIPEVHGFNIPFCEADSVRFCFMEKSGRLDELKKMEYNGEYISAPTFKGQILEPSEVKTSYMLTQNSRSATPLLYDLKEDQFIWIDSNINVDGIVNAVNRKVLNKTTIVLYESKHNDYPDMKTLFTKYTKANGGTITEDIKEADLVFTFGNVDRDSLEIREDAEVISSLELDRISADFCGRVAK